VVVSGANFGASQGTGGVTFNGNPAVVTSWSDTTIVTAVAAGSTTGNVMVTTGLGAVSNVINFVVNAQGPVLQLSINDAPLQVNLTSPQVLDWIHWGRISATLPDRKNGVTPLISDYTVINGAQPTSSFGNIAFSWTDGNHPPTVSDASENVETFTLVGSGFQITVPADTSVKTLNLYAEVLFGQGQLQASLSDGSAAAISDQSVIDADVASKVYSIDFRAASAGQTLTVTFTSLNATGGIALQAATLTPHLPVVAIAAPGPGQTFPAPATVALNAGATQFDSSVTGVQATGSDGSILQANSSTLTAPWGPLVGGHYSITATATDSAGLTNTSAQVETDVIGQGGTLSIQRSDVSSPVDLTVQGPADWVLWGPFDGGDTITDNPGDVLTRMTGVAPLISNYEPIGNHFIDPVIFANNLGFTNGSNTLAAENVGGQLQVFGQNDGYQITVPADSTQRTLQLYASAVSARGKLTAFLSDGSAAVVADSSFDDPNGADANGFSATTVYSISYSAASAGQTLTLRYTMDHDYGSGEVGLIGAALSGTPVTPTVPAPQIASISPPSAPIDTRVSISGTNFGATQGDSQVLFGGFSGQVVSWSDTNIVVYVPAALTAGRTVDVVVLGDQGGSNAVSFAVLSYKVSPTSLGLVVGDSRTLRVTDLSGNPITGLGWSTSDPTVVTLSSSDPPLITAVGVGSAQVWAGDIPVPVTVYAGTSLPPGVPVWSAPIDPGATASLVPAVPSSNGVDVFAYDGNLWAFSADGSPVWKAVPDLPVVNVIPDFAGGALLKTLQISTDAQGNDHATHYVEKIDPNTSQTTVLYTFTTVKTGAFPFTYNDTNRVQTIIPHPSGVLFVQDNTTVVVIDPSTNQQIASVTADQGTLTDPSGVVAHFDAQVSPIIVAGDGNAYMPYQYANIVSSTSLDDLGETTDHEHNTGFEVLLRVSPDGSSAKIQLDTWTFDTTFTNTISLPGIPADENPMGVHTTFSGTAGENLGNVITNADNGATVAASVLQGGCADFWIGSYQTLDANGNPTVGHKFFQETGCPDPNKKQTKLFTVSQDSLTGQATANVLFTPSLQREDGNYIGTLEDGSLAAVGLDGSVPWQVKVNPDAFGNPTRVTPLYATADGGAVVTSSTTTRDPATQFITSQTPGTLYSFDENGNPTGQTADTGAVLSWRGETYAPTAGALSQVNSAIVLDEASFWAAAGGNPTGNRASAVGCPCLFQSDTSGSAPAGAGTIASQLTLQSDLRHSQTAVSAVTPAAPLICPICDLPAPTVDQPPPCTSVAGTQSTYLLLVGDSGNGIHNGGNLFNLAAQQNMNELNSQGHSVVACRVSSVQNVHSALLQNGFIDGGVTFFTHGGPHDLIDENGLKVGQVSILAVGQATGPDTNVSFLNVNTLSNIQTAHNGHNIVGPNASMLINGCSAAKNIFDTYAGFTTSIARQLYINTSVQVKAYSVGMYFSALDAAHDTKFGPKKGDLAPGSLPLYLVPLGPPGHKPGPVSIPGP
jgi:hypothetical protein